MIRLKSDIYEERARNWFILALCLGLVGVVGFACAVWVAFASLSLAALAPLGVGILFSYGAGLAGEKAANWNRKAIQEMVFHCSGRRWGK